MPEISLTGPNPLVYPHLTTWGWQIALYLFLGGLVAGLMVLSGAMRLLGRAGWERVQLVSDIAAAPLLAVGLLALVLDLSKPFNFWRLFTTFQPRSAISWGSWILLVSLLLLGLRFLTRLPVAPSAPAPVPVAVRKGRRLAGLWQRLKSSVVGATLAVWRLLQWLCSLAERYHRPLAVVSVGLGICVGFYTGVLLSTMSARPLWNSAALAPLFLVSGLAAGSAFTCLFLPDHEHKQLAPLSLLLCGMELVLILAYAISLSFGLAGAQQAAGLLFGGRYGLLFWGVVVLVGLLVPATLEALTVRGRSAPQMLSRLPALLKLAGGVTLRFVIVAAGLLSAL